ncbi:DHA2 family efflux MFS transporter permease subunit [Virgibacillus halodenitrificans]|uniref:DHA2 family efflux MFS transporter permease subunit n=1 Tax=Virgibacillus halodenitrificans TaxID=1482 RepID=A0ABR7VI87_VIRHA|nr:DHA2 family efflux MFS transporter permease subunit [Virgibacillus halodenitrificans]MBD1221637.1 DHA2 family efflux MFS transporter permease subunit [Virgibacillus halodenitrificans]MEC2160624.1 DHA2 family efflux MFS transporter permease subunit [Virgibacillus halodenitrificans]MYL47394.1 DHA2 family efflux MFS transporter permease subunit [Virgibacillus halodenitrificans]MYL57613.1 DHA2 family efflux MFS transporter permease subunit [Virgibacillus halodenitrificans]WHX24826.1 DHA2 family
MRNEEVTDIQNINKLPIVAVLITGAFLAILNQTLLATAIPHIMDDLHLTENTAQWVTTIFMLVNGIMIPITAFLIETFTTRRLFLTAMSIFAFGTLICAVSPNFGILMTGRIVQAAGAGIMMPLMMTIFLLIFPVEKRGSAMGTVGLVISFAPALGPVISGWLVEHYPWRSLFLIVLPLAIIDVIVAFFIMKNITTRTFPKVDYISIVLSTLGFGGLLYGFSSAGNSGWSNTIVLLSLAIGAICLTIFILRQFKLAQPILEFRVFKNKIFTITTVIGMIAFIGLIAAETILPIYMQNMAGYSALDSGLMILPGALIMGIMSPINGRIFDRFGARYLVIVGLLILTITSFLYTNLTPDTSLSYITVVFAVRMFGISMIMMPSTTAGLNQLSNKLIPHGSAMVNTMRQVAASIGTALLITIMTATALNTGKNATPSELIHGVNVAFYVATGLSFVGLILALYIKGTTPHEDRARVEQEEG